MDQVSFLLVVSGRNCNRGMARCSAGVAAASRLLPLPAVYEIIDRKSVV